MSITLIDTIRQAGGAIFPLLEDRDLLGGFRVVETTSSGSDWPTVQSRDKIPASYRKTGMFVFVADISKLYRLTSAPAAMPGTWVEFTGAGGVSNAVSDTDLLAGEDLTAGWVVAVDGSSGVIKADASVSGYPQEVYGLVTSDALTGDAATIVTSGVASYAPGGLIPGDVLYLAQGGGMPTSISGSSGGTFPDGSVAGRSIIRIGQARTTTTIQVRVQFIGRT